MASQLNIYARRERVFLETMVFTLSHAEEQNKPIKERRRGASNCNKKREEIVET